jgi:predicted Fe-S protein YdhL (DUF1289 family)
MSKRKVKSPCIDICKMDKLSGLCRGCLRTIPEIKAWKGLSREEQKALLIELDSRRARQAQPLADLEPCP